MPFGVFGVGWGGMRPLPIWSFGSVFIASYYVYSPTQINQLRASECQSQREAESEGLGLKDSNSQP